MARKGRKAGRPTWRRGDERHDSDGGSAARLRRVLSNHVTTGHKPRREKQRTERARTAATIGLRSSGTRAKAFTLAGARVAICVWPSGVATQHLSASIFFSILARKRAAVWASAIAVASANATPL
jgi:hypothetical protein